MASNKPLSVAQQRRTYTISCAECFHPSTMHVAPLHARLTQYHGFLLQRTGDLVAAFHTALLRHYLPMLRSSEENLKELLRTLKLRTAPPCVSLYVLPQVSGPSKIEKFSTLQLEAWTLMTRIHCNSFMAEEGQAINLQERHEFL